MTPTFQVARLGTIEKVYGASGALGEVSSSTRDKLGVARTAYSSSGVARNKVSDFEAVKSRYNLHQYAAYTLNTLSHYPWGSDSDAGAVAEQLRYLSKKTTADIGNLFTNNLMWLAKSDVRGRSELRKALAFFYAQSRPGKPLSSQLNSSEKKVLTNWAETQDKKRVESDADDRARSRLEAEGYRKADTTGDRLSSGTYYYKNGYKFEVRNDGTMTKVTSSGAKTEYKTGGAEYAKIRDAIREDLISGSASTVKFPPRRQAVAESVPESSPEAAAPATSLIGQSLTDQWWFWPTVGVSTIAAGVGIYFAFLRKR